jgi:hypothetical protein
MWPSGRYIDGKGISSLSPDYRRAQVQKARNASYMSEIRLLAATKSNKGTHKSGKQIMATARVSALKWAGYGAAFGVAVALLQILTRESAPSVPIANYLGNLFGGAVFFGIIGAITAGIRNKSKR